MNILDHLITSVPQPQEPTRDEIFAKQKEVAAPLYAALEKGLDRKPTLYEVSCLAIMGLMSAFRDSHTVVKNAVGVLANALIDLDIHEWHEKNPNVQSTLLDARGQMISSIPSDNSNAVLSKPEQREDRAAILTQDGARYK